MPAVSLCVCVGTRNTWQRLVSDEAACFSQQPSVCAQETINKEGISWTIAARLAPCAPWEQEEEERRREGRLEEDEVGKEEGIESMIGDGVVGGGKKRNRGIKGESRREGLKNCEKGSVQRTVLSLCHRFSLHQLHLLFSVPPLFCWTKGLLTCQNIPRSVICFSRISTLSLPF